MIRQTRRLGLWRPALPALLVLGLWLPAAAAQALPAALLFRNQCGAPVVVQAVSVFRGVVHRGRPFLLVHGAATPPIVLPGDKIVTVYDAKVPNRILFQGPFAPPARDLYFDIVPDRVPGRLTLLDRTPHPPPPRRPAPGAGRGR
jgi:hypothetical protein